MRPQYDQLKDIDQEDVRYMKDAEEIKRLRFEKKQDLSKLINESSGQRMVCKFCLR